MGDTRDTDAQREWRESWAGWDELPVSESARLGYNALHDESGGGYPGDVPGARWMDGVPHRYWDEAEVDMAAQAWGEDW